MSERFDVSKNRYEGLLAQINDKKKRCAAIEDYLEVLKAQNGRVTKFSPEMWCGMVDFVTVGAQMVFTFRDGTEIAV